MVEEERSELKQPWVEKRGTEEEKLNEWEVKRRKGPRPDVNSTLWGGLVKVTILHYVVYSTI